MPVLFAQAPTPTPIYRLPGTAPHILPNTRVAPTCYDVGSFDSHDQPHTAAPPSTRAGATRTTSDVIPLSIYDGSLPNSSSPDMPHTTSDVSPSDDNDRPHTYHHIPTRTRNPHAKADTNPFDSCGEPKPNSHIPTHVGAPRANRDADSSDSCSGPNISCHSFLDFINASAARTSSNAHPFDFYRLPSTDYHNLPNARVAPTR